MTAALWRPLAEAPFFTAVAERSARGERGLVLTGLIDAARALVLGLLAERLQRPLLLVVPDESALDAWRRDLAALAALAGRDPARILGMPALDADPYDAIAAHPEIVRERVVALERVRRGEVDALLVPARALLQWLPAPQAWSDWSRRIVPGDTVAPDRFVLQAMGLGYRRVEIVGAPGEVSRRGGIVDIFPPLSDEPVRLELFGDSVESLRSFDTDHQRSTGQLDAVTVGPAVENPPTDEALARLSAYLDAGTVAAARQETRLLLLRERLETLRAQGYWPGGEALARLTAERPVLLFDYVRPFVLAVDEPARVAAELERAAHDLEVAYEQGEDRILPPPRELFAAPHAVDAELAGAVLQLEELAGEAQPDVICRAARSYGGRIAELVADLRRAREEGRRVVCVMRAPGGAQRLLEILGEYDLPAARLDGPALDGADPWGPGGLFVGVAGLRSGFEFSDPALVVLSEREVFGEERQVAERRAGARAAFLSDFRDLKTGDLVVHVDHGVARYAGLGRPKGGSLNRDFMVLEFDGGDRLFVPVDRLDLVQKYSGVAGHKPALDRLGGPGWERVKSRVRKSVQEMARDLLELYARRRAARGHAFSADTPWQAELEAAFPFELTPDQERAIAEVKRDMESDRPMDRLLVGDVGFGKTEVAVRAAFKTVMDGQQVAVLSPTTVLAFQHFQTISERFAPFPVKVELVSRFRTAAQVRQTLHQLEAGSVDVVVGTHRLLSKDVVFKRLGLIVVDEEQRFGVAHKERLKRLAIGVEVLSMTATPIPRTLQMSLAGVRDLSVIETPPAGRLAIKTYLVPFRRNVLAQAIRQELRRKGQVFVVHNRVETLPAIARAVSEMVPDARLVVAHGQMPERQLEQVMLRFVRHDADVLITTTIIENGLDIPRANTIIVNRADRFGLAQLYQLRGRVGRSQEHAYCYLITPARQRLSDEAARRLRALQEFSELGAGFRLAAADLEIRGAGELLGSRQHGHIAALGFDLYCQMLETAVRELSGEPVVERRPASLHLGVDIKIPESYLPDAGDRLVLYKRLAAAQSAADVARLRAEAEDRFGHAPRAAQNLFELARLRLVAEEAGVKSVDLANDTLHLRFHDRPPLEPQRVVELVARERGSLTPSGALLLPAPPRGEDRIQAVERLLLQMLGRSAA
ncbi:MAG TPA: transcription-repair coupling factor [Candidatus Polarisedimenticolaceae bacterium]|nr:transcription-repair coupling factor [Candidatus Polarisedimenticolaceae bacterium]